MKKLLCVLLIVALLIPAAVLADDPDPIVGCWYMYYDKLFCPEMESSFPGVDKTICVYIFSESGINNITGARVIGSTGTPEYSAGGKWKKTADGYEISLIGYGENTPSFIQDDYLCLAIQGLSGYYMRFRKMYPFNPYQDYIKK